MRERIPANCVQAVIAPGFLGSDTARCPLLIDLRTMSPRDLGHLSDSLETQVQNREETACSLLLASSLPCAELAARLARRLAVTVEPGGPAKQFRFFDPGTFLQLPRLLGDAGLAWLLQGVDSVWVPWAAEWTCVERPAVRDPFHLTAGHVQTLLRVGVVNRVAAQLNPPANALAWMEQCAEIDQHVRRGAVQHALTRQADLVSFALHAMRYHPRFDSHPRIRDLLNTLRNADAGDELDYRELSCCLKPNDWADVMRDLGSAPNELQGTAP
jgi:hypothetical protein